MKSIFINRKIASIPASLRADIKRVFNEQWYMHRYPDVRKIVNSGKKTALHHFLEYGIREGRSPNAVFDFEYLAEKVRLERGLEFNDYTKLAEYFFKDNDNNILSTHALFDPAWYLLHNEDVRVLYESGRTYPLRHFVEHGASENRAPNAMFDPAWYLRNYPDAADLVVKGFLTAIDHYTLLGAPRAYSPSAAFDADWYLRQNADVKQAVLQDGIDALTHYLRHGKKEGRRITPSRRTPTSARFGLAGDHAQEGSTEQVAAREQIRLSDFPVVSIIIANHNGESHLNDLIHSLQRQTYKNFEIVFVDNKSTDGSVSLIKDIAPDSRVIELGENLGFAEANNIGQYFSSGEILALLNNDTRVNSEWLSSAVNILKNNPTAGAVASKIRFWEKFCTVDFWSRDRFELSKVELLDSLSYKKVFLNFGREDGQHLVPEDVGGEYWLSVKVPVQRSSIQICISTATPEQAVKLESGFRTLVDHANKHKIRLDFDLGAGAIERSRYVINNAGSCEGEDLSPYDRGYGEYDEGQYDELEPVPLFCGCSAIIRRDALAGETLFLSDLYAYFEDSELSKRITRRGFNIIYSPASLVYHRHSSTSVEKSLFWHKQVKQNEILYKYIQTSDADRQKYLESRLADLNHDVHYLQNKGDKRNKDEAIYYAALPDIVRGVVSITEKIETGRASTKLPLRVGIYNDHWRSLGGGEAHALNFLRYLGTKAAVELISRNDFDLNSTLNYYGIEHYNVRKRLVKSMTPQVTAEYDIFINGSYMNECPSLASKSYYILHFPSRAPSKEFLSSYTFLANSKYTLSWAERFWGKANFKAKLVYPSIARGVVKFDPAHPNLSKEKIIISVGRFFSAGHSKNQHVIAEIFRKLVDAGKLQDWRLLLVGSSNDEEYRSSISRSLLGYDASVVTNAPFDWLARMYEQSSVYIHASGFAKSAHDEPENFEHFGMTVVEATMNGCFPVVYREAGPLEIVQTLGTGYTYDTIEEGMMMLERICKDMETAQERAKISSEVARASRRIFTISDSDLAMRQLEDLFGLGRRLENPARSGAM